MEAFRFVHASLPEGWHEMEDGPERRASFARAWARQVSGPESVVTLRAKNDAYYERFLQQLQHTELEAPVCELCDEAGAEEDTAEEEHAGVAALSIRAHDELAPQARARSELAAPGRDAAAGPERGGSRSGSAAGNDRGGTRGDWPAERTRGERSGAWGDRGRGSNDSSWGDRREGSGNSSWGDRSRGGGNSSWGDRSRGGGDGSWGDRSRGGGDGSWGDRSRGGAPVARYRPPQQRGGVEGSRRGGGLTEGGGGLGGGPSMRCQCQRPAHASFQGLTTYAPPHAVTTRNLPRGYRSLLGDLGQFCRAFYHANQWEADVCLCLGYPVNATGDALDPPVEGGADSPDGKCPDTPRRTERGRTALDTRDKCTKAQVTALGLASDSRSPGCPRIARGIASDLPL